MAHVLTLNAKKNPEPKGWDSGQRSFNVTGKYEGGKMFRVCTIYDNKNCEKQKGKRFAVHFHMNEEYKYDHGENLLKAGDRLKSNDFEAILTAIRAVVVANMKELRKRQAEAEAFLGTIVGVPVEWRKSLTERENIIGIKGTVIDSRGEKTKYYPVSGLSPEKLMGLLISHNSYIVDDFTYNNFQITDLKLVVESTRLSSKSIIERPLAWSHQREVGTHKYHTGFSHRDPVAFTEA